ncbi:MAG: hypothetical protein IT178_03380 [Acidobacteria bacterium]|nr:hypothetical protein [Acidobacteriota bacterium]
MRWDVAAPGCSPDPAPIPVPLADEAALEPDRQGIAATWEWRLDDRDVLLIAHFVEDDHLLKLCSWDTADL